MNDEGNRFHFSRLLQLRVAAIVFALVAGFIFTFERAGAQTLPAHKDRLFRYPAIIESADNGAYRIIDYREQRDINGRDQVPERRVKRQYVDLSVRRRQQDLTLDTSAGPLALTAAGKIEGASLITVFIHGRGGDRSLGVDDYTFGGNFNRIKNLMSKAGGLYLSPSADDFGRDNADRISAAIGAFLKTSPSAGLVLACGSAGGDICYRLANDDSLVSRLRGIAFLGSFADSSYVRSTAAAKKIPVFIGHGSRDTVFPVETMEEMYRGLRGAGIPVRMVRFETGTHGTPIRMTDWRETINWMVSN